MDEINPFVIFEVRLDKDRGIVVITIRKEEDDEVHFFRYHHQPLNCHPEELQESIRSHKVTVRTKSIKVDIYAYCEHYYNERMKCFEIKGVKLNSNKQQLQKVLNTRINKEIGLLKRKEGTSAKDRKETELGALKEKSAKFEQEFQEERAKRIAAAMADIKKKKEEGKN